MGWGRFKPLLAEAAVEALRPVQERYGELRENPEFLTSVLSKGREQAAAVARQTLGRVRQALGFLTAPEVPQGARQGRG